MFSIKNASISLAVAVLAGDSAAHADMFVFDNISNARNSVAGATVTGTASTPNTFMGGAYTLAAGTTQISGFDFYPVNLSGTSYTGLQITISVWGGVNTSGTVNASTPAFSNLLGTYTFTRSVTFSSGFYFAFESSPVGANPGYTLSSPLTVPSTTIGLSFNYQGTTDGVAYASHNGLSSIISAGTSPTVGSLVLGGSNGGYYRNANSEVNGNFTSTLRSLGGLTQQALAVRIYAPSAVPEPSGYAAVAGVALVAFGAWRRVRK